jgi:hypothetical protein
LLAVFVVANASLIKLRYSENIRSAGYRVPLNVGRFPVTAGIGLLSSLGLVLFYLFQLVV